MSRDARWKSLLELLVERGRLDVEEAAAELGVSAATIRRDFDQLAEQQMLVRTRGGAVVHGVSYELPLRYKTARNASEKERIAKAVAELITPGEAVGLTGGTTTTEVARALAVRPDLASGSPALTIVTNALNIANELAVRPQFKIVVTGGVARPQSYELIGPLADGVLSQITIDTAVLGVVGFDVAHGAAAHDEAEAAINRLLCERAERVVVAADSSKLGQRAFARICSTERIGTLVTDSAVDAATVERFEEAGVKVLAV
ncbi:MULTISPECIES: DeoR/GlpR family DNA-binding transcription regulator [unclassified Streptomyces]|uniref:DeoR/GlpR family DNA-binding transcription regulator n=1 Tax=Streptomyces sp. NBC_00119 TaxID=2975659 RepID=A0AAU1UFL8_9ACTN|nr:MULTISPECIES: DeoR/GlpR family DNA-binding transcription regulator [unclassified Streptomyces]MCX4647237.1 DeoR/GlpR family DNA-binding transcription regulator [Streptomyces sp. NBC_01446]MCX5435459.1 DeoR/GlpR family DNA-binding transcription regulator [Streptomyces sp. NBC_00063]WSE13247.1 DeoR/GlpR family DNA-binding transcription regulator [Streptomyces sp. NBC_01397]WUB97837.1 DeoR/GlpR family DNA-binding transcription regulator [Streptomyces sp. NBC_00569]